MRTTILSAALILTLITFFDGHAISIIIVLISKPFDLGGPYSPGWIAWAWFGFSLLFLFTISFVFCRWFAGRISKHLKQDPFA